MFHEEEHALWRDQLKQSSEIFSLHVCCPLVMTISSNLVYEAFFYQNKQTGLILANSNKLRGGHVCTAVV